MNFRSRERRVDSDFNLVPLVDVMAMLLFFFMMATTFVGAAGVDIKLPSSRTARQQQSVDKVDISVTQAGDLYWDNAPLPESALLSRLAQTHAANPDALVVIRADTHAMHGRVFTVMEAAREAGLNRIAVAAEGEGAGAP